MKARDSPGRTECSIQGRVEAEQGREKRKRKQGRRKIPLLRYYIVLISVGGYSAEIRRKLIHQYTGILSPEICHRYNQFLENIGIIQKDDSSDM